MKKIATLFLIIVMLFVITAAFVGCGSNDLTDLENRMTALEERVEKLETTISILDSIGDSAEFAELKSKVIALQIDLAKNNTSDEQIKSQVTQMQLVLDELYNSGSAQETVLSNIQTNLNALYGEVDRVLPFENGKEYEVKLNGVVYYKVSVLIEYHDGLVQSEQDIKTCSPQSTAFLKKHFCGSVIIKNMGCYDIKVADMMGAMIYTSDEFYGFYPCESNKEGWQTNEVPTYVKPGKEEKVYFYLYGSEENMPKNNFKVTFRMPEVKSLTLLTLDNIWTDKDGIMPPIVG